MFQFRWYFAAAFINFLLRFLSINRFIKKSQSSFAIPKPSLTFFKFKAQNLLKPPLQNSLKLSSSSSIECGVNIFSKSCDSTNSWTSLDSICSKSSRPIPFVSRAMVHRGLIIFYHQNRPQFFPAWCQCLWLQFLQRFVYINNAFRYDKMFATSYNVHNWINFHGV